MTATDTFLASCTNADGTPKYRNYYEHLPKINAAIAEQDRIIAARTAAGWDADPEYGWGGPNPLTGESMTESEYIDAGFILPEDAKGGGLSDDAWRIYHVISCEASALSKAFCKMDYDDPERVKTIEQSLALARVATAIINGRI